MKFFRKSPNKPMSKQTNNQIFHKKKTICTSITCLNLKNFITLNTQSQGPMSATQSKSRVVSIFPLWKKRQLITRPTSKLKNKLKNNTTKKSQKPKPKLKKLTKKLRIFNLMRKTQSLTNKKLRSKTKQKVQNKSFNKFLKIPPSLKR